MNKDTHFLCSSDDWRDDIGCVINNNTRGRRHTSAAYNINGCGGELAIEKWLQNVETRSRVELTSRCLRAFVLPCTADNNSEEIGERLAAVVGVCVDGGAGVTVCHV